MRQLIDLPIEKMVRCYEGGESTRAIARAYGVSQWTAWRRLVTGGARMRRPGRRRSGPLLYLYKGNYLVTRDRNGRLAKVHRGCWEAHNGPVPGGSVVHHINADTLDNAIGNLACMSLGAHSALHRRQSAMVLPIDEMAARYRAGETTREIAKAYGVCHYTAWKRLVAAGVKMRPCGPVPTHRHTTRRGGSLALRS